MKASDLPRRIRGVHVIVLGIDPGVANTGYGVVAHQRGRVVALDGGVIETRAGTDAGLRLAHIHARVVELIDEYQPDAVAVAVSGLGVGHAQALDFGSRFTPAHRAGFDAVGRCRHRLGEQEGGVGRARRAAAEDVVDGRVNGCVHGRPR